MDNVIDFVNQNQNEFTWEANNCMLSHENPNYDHKDCQENAEEDDEDICIDQNLQLFSEISPSQGGNQLSYK